jgi:predicted Zn-ribbon and HTH transcriptional regulator
MCAGYYKLFLSGKKIYIVSPVVGKKCRNCGFDFTDTKNREFY